MAKSRRMPAAGKAAATAAVALAGAAAAGGRLALDRRAGSKRDPRPDRAYRLRRDEDVADGVRRIARGRIDDAHDRLLAASANELGAAVHDTRKDLKRLRACVRLARPALGEATYERENTALRMAGRRLSGARDAQVLVETLDALTARFAAELPPALTSALRARLLEEREQATAALRDDDAALAATRADLAAARTRVASWTLAGDGFEALAPGLRRIHARGRTRLRAAAKDPTDENLHEARKRVKDLWYATQLVRAAKPKTLERLSARAHDLANVLGDDHDLAVLRARVLAHPQCFEDDASLQALLAVLDRRRAALQRRASKLADRVYDVPSKRFAARIARGWRQRAEQQPRPLAG